MIIASPKSPIALPPSPGDTSRITFFAVVIAIWLGLNNSARVLVRERRLYVRDRLAGLRPTAYLGAKAAVHAAVGVAQVLILLTVLRVGCGDAAETAFPPFEGPKHRQDQAH